MQVIFKKIKPLTLISISLLLLAACSHPKQGSDANPLTDSFKSALKSGDTLNAIIDKNIDKLPVIDTVVLGFSFSMTKKQALEHYNQLVKSKKLIMNEKDSRYEYPMAFELVKANASLAPEFEGDKLYKLSLVIESSDEMATTETVFLQAATTYMKKYSNFTLFQEPDLIDPKEKSFHWIKNNLHIYLHKTVEGTVVNYINMPVERAMETKKSENADSSKKQTKNDI